METSTIISCATFLISSILACLAFLVLVVTVLLINNLIIKYWKPVKFFHYLTDPNNERHGTK